MNIPNGSAGALAASVLIALSTTSSAAPWQANSDDPASARVDDGRARAPAAWVHTVGVTPTGEHERHIIGAFVGADLNMDGMLSVDEYRQLVQARADYLFDQAGKLDGETLEGGEIGPREDLTAFAMADLEGQFDVADRNRDGGLTVHEVYYFETFDRPGVFPPKQESVPQAVAGDWEQLTVEEHAPVYHTPPFSPRRHREAMGAGGFDAVDGNGDGTITLFEASDYSLLSWTPAVHAFARADDDDDGRLEQDEFARFQSVVAEFPPRKERPGRFPSDGG